MQLTRHIPILLFLCCSIAHKDDGNHLQVNWSLVADTIQPITYPTPELEYVLPSSCDISNNCDISSCSNQECTEEDNLAFNCEMGRFKFGVSPSWGISDCRQMPGPFCIYRHNSPYIGDVFPEEVTIMDSLSQFNDRLQSSHKVQYFKPSYEFRKSGLDTSIGYKHGNPVEWLNTAGRKEALKLPGNILHSSFCSNRLTVQYLRDRKSTCHSKITPLTCSQLKQNNYIFNNIMSGYLDNKFDFNVTTQKAQIAPPGSLVFLGRASSKCLLNVSHNLPHDICEDAVVLADYIFKWNGSILAGLEASLLLADVPTSPYCSAVVYLKQRFTVHFKHASVNDTMDTSSAANGYKIGDILVFH